MRGVLLGALLAIAMAAPVSAQTIETTDPILCLEPAPAAITPPPFADPIDIRVLVLLDGVNEVDARVALRDAAEAYGPLALRLTPVGFRHVSLDGTDAAGLIAQAKETLGGGRPDGADLVYVLTSEDMTLGASGSANAGLADCIGGAAFAESAFAVGENGNAAGLIAAHELGHLMGAHHHYANCAEALCTLMINDIGLAARPIEFSTLNGAIIRGHAETYLPGDPHVPPPAPPEPGSPAEPYGEHQEAGEPEQAPPHTAYADEPQSGPAAPASAPASSEAPADAEQERLDRACTRAVQAAARADAAVRTARKRYRRARTPARRRALRKSLAAHARAERLERRACLTGG